MGALFDPSKIRVPEPEGPETVGELTHRITAVLEDSFADAWVVGEISNFNRHTSGHIFFTLKDEWASIRCVLWKSAAGRLGRDIGDGVEVEVRGRIGVFEKQGNYQVYVSSIRPRGMGALEVAFRKLKERLEKEGLFAEARKRPLPRFPRRVGVVTSPTGAAVRDIIHVLTRRWPAAEIVLAPARVQGEGAAAEIVGGIENLNRLGGIDVMIVGRGGGSLEDLWPFNEEVVARAIYASAVPVVSAVGHETDFSISDFVADVRAPTPSAAAEMVVPDRKEILAAVDSLQGRLGRGLMHIVDLLRDGLALFAAHRFFRYPQDIVLTRVQVIDDAAQHLLAAMKDKGAAQWMRLERAAGGLARHSPQARWRESEAALKMATFRLHTAARTLLAHRWTVAVGRLAGRLEDLNPDRVLARGYSRTVLDRTGRILTRAADATTGDLIRTHLAQGVLKSRVTEAEAGAPAGVSAEGPPAEVRREEPRKQAKKKGRDSGPSLFE
jgi:exodeoxyribonuclease VII large subunit